MVYTCALKALLLILCASSASAVPPAVSITSPADGAFVSGSVNITANASSAIGISSVQFQVDWADLGGAQLTTPYAISWDSARVGANRPIYDSLLYTGKPSVAAYGLAPILLVYENAFWPAGAGHDQPDQATVQRVALTLPTDRPVCVDIEAWSLSISSLPATIAKLIQVADWIHQAKPGVKMGFYSMLPVRNYWDAQNGPGNAGYDLWVQQNTMLAQVSAHVDYIFPSVYTFYDDQIGWQKYADANIQQARRYGKPVYSFLMTTYHESNAVLKGQSIPGDYWRRQLDTTQTRGDGTVIWGGWQMAWDANAPWWLVTQAVADPAAQGVHALSAKAWDAAGGVSISAPVYVIIDNRLSIPAPPRNFRTQ